MTTTYRVVDAVLVSNVATLGLVTVEGLHTGYSIHVDGVGQHYNGNHTLTAVDEDEATVSFAFTHANIASTDVWGQLNIRVTWVDDNEVVTFLGLTPTDTVDVDFLAYATEAANVWAFDRRQAAGYDDLPGYVPSDKVRLGTILKAGELYRQRGSLDGFNSFQNLEGMAPVSSSAEILRLLGINRPAIA